MKRHNKKFILITIIISSLLLYGCKNIRLSTYNNTDDSGSKTEQTATEIPADAQNKTSEEVKDTKVLAEEEKDTPDSKEEQDDKNTPIAPAVIQPAANVDLVIYTVNNSAEVEAATALIPKDTEITPQLIVDTVKESMAGYSLMVGIESVTTEGDAVIVSFYSDQPPLSNVGAGFETAILDAIAQSLVDNLDDFNKVIYRVEGEAYISGHVELGIDEVYLVD